MSKFLVPTPGQSTYQLGVCGRCNRKFFINQLSPDPNIPGLYVCDKDIDLFDPWRLPQRESEKITGPINRPDVSLTSSDSGNSYLITEDGLGLYDNAPLVDETSGDTDIQPRRAIRQD